MGKFLGLFGYRLRPRTPMEAILFRPGGDWVTPTLGWFLVATLAFGVGSLLGGESVLLLAIILTVGAITLVGVLAIWAYDRLIDILARIY